MAMRAIATAGSCHVCVIRHAGETGDVHLLRSGQFRLLTELAAVHVSTERDRSDSYWLDTWRIPLTGKTRTVVGTDGVCRVLPLTVDDVSRRLRSKGMPAVTYGVGKVGRTVAGSGPEKVRKIGADVRRLSDRLERQGDVAEFMCMIFGEATGGAEFRSAPRKDAVADYPATFLGSVDDWFTLCNRWNDLPTLFHYLEDCWAWSMAFGSAEETQRADWRKRLLNGWISSSLNRSLPSDRMKWAERIAAMANAVLRIHLLDQFAVRNPNAACPRGLWFIGTDPTSVFVTAGEVLANYGSKLEDAELAVWIAGQFAPNIIWSN